MRHAWSTGRCDPGDHVPAVLSGRRPESGRFTGVDHSLSASAASARVIVPRMSNPNGLPSRYGISGLHVAPFEPRVAFGYSVT